MRAQELARALGTWFAETWDWSLFFTLTIRDHERGPRAGLPRGIAASERLLERWAKGSIESRGGYWFAAMESHAYRITPHFHGIAGGFYEEPSRIAMWREWRELTWQGIDETGREIAARAQIEPIGDLIRSAIYVAKYVNKGVGKIYTGGELERRKRDGSGLLAPWFLAPTLSRGPSGAGKKAECPRRFGGKT